MSHGERPIAHATRAAQQRQRDRKQRRSDRTQGDYASNPTGESHTCGSCQGEFDAIDMVPGGETCLHCHLAEEAAAGVNTGDAAWLKTTLLHLGAQAGGAGLAWAVAQSARADQWFGFMMIAVVFALGGGIVAMNHAKQSPNRHWVRYPLTAFHGLAIIAWFAALAFHVIAA